MDFLTAAEAADLLGVKTATLYAYVSRGLLDSVPDPGDSRQRRYRRADLDRLKRRSRAHAGHGAAAAGALEWGAPTLETALCRITPEGPAYRGRPVAALVEAGTPWEAVAELLWTGEVGHGAPWEADEVGRIGAPDLPPLDVLRVAVTLAGVRDGARFAAAGDAQVEVARRLVTGAVAALAERPGALPPAPGAPVADTLARAFGREPDPPLRRALDAALVAAADHELNASTFAARVAASTGADLYACVAAALATFTGPRHGGACERCAALLAEVDAGGTPRAVLEGRLRRGETPAGFGHALYPDGDPRFALLVGAAEAATGAGAGSAVRDEARALAEAGAALGLGAPTSDMGLVLLVRALGLPDEAAGALFAVGRMAGWIAHALEQRRQGFLLRPRARYVGG